MSYPGYEPVKILDTFAKIDGQQVFYSASREEYSIERDHREDDQAHLAPLTEVEQEVFNELLAFEKRVRDTHDRHDDDGKEDGR